MLYELLAGLEFAFCGVAGEGQAVEIGDVLVGAFGKVPSHFEDKWAVHVVEGLLGDGGLGSLGGVDIRVGEVERLEEAGEAAAVNLGIVGLAPGEGMLGDANRMAADSEVELAADVEQGVALGFKVEATAVLSAEKRVGRVGFRGWGEAI